MKYLLLLLLVGCSKYSTGDCYLTDKTKIVVTGNKNGKYQVDITLDGKIQKRVYSKKAFEAEMSSFKHRSCNE
jgi:hypothetical protein